MTRSFAKHCIRWLVLLFTTAALTGCMTRRDRLMDERSTLLRERGQILDPWQPHTKQEHVHKDGEEQPSAGDRTQKIDQRVAEIDAELMELK